MGITIDYTGIMDDIWLDSGFEEAITYTASGGAATEIQSIVFHDPAEEYNGKNVRGNQYRKVIIVSKTDVPAVTKQEDTVIIASNNSSRTYRVNGIIYEDLGSFHLGCN